MRRDGRVSLRRTLGKRVKGNSFVGSNPTSPPKKLKI